MILKRKPKYVGYPIWINTPEVYWQFFAKYSKRYENILSFSVN